MTVLLWQMDREATDDFTFDDEIEITQNMPRYAEKVRQIL